MKSGVLTLANEVWESVMRLPLAVVLAREDGQILTVNVAFCHLLGYSEAELESMKLTDITHHDDVDAELESSRQLFHREISAFAAEMRYKRKDGRCISVAVSTTAFLKDGKPLYTARIVQDITERLRLEAALEENGENFRQLCEASMEGVLLYDDGQIVLANQALARMFGYDNNAEIGKLPPEALFVSKSWRLVLQHFQTGNGYPLETMGLRKDGSTFPIRLRAKGIKYEGRRVRLSTIQPSSRGVKGADSEPERTRTKNTVPLSPRELEVFRMVVRGVNNLDISRALGISRRTVEHHVSHILTKLGAANRTAAVLAAYGSGLLAELERPADA